MADKYFLNFSQYQLGALLTSHFLTGLTALQSLRLYRCKGVSDLSPLARLTALQSLSLSDCEGLSDLTLFAGLTALQSLSLYGC